MSTKTQTNSTQTAQYDPGSLNTFQGLQPGIQQNLTEDMKLDPTQSKTFNLGLQYAMKQNQMLKDRTKQNLMGNMQGSGFAGSVNPFQQAQMNKMSRAGMALDAQTTNQNYLNYDAMRRQTVANAMQYKPLQTGQTGQTTQTTSGLGTWLPQVIGAGAQIGLGIATAGTSTAASAGSKAASGLAGTASSLGGDIGNAAMSSGSYFSNANPFTAGNTGNMGLGMFNSNAYPGANYFSGGR